MFATKKAVIQKNPTPRLGVRGQEFTQLIKTLLSKTKLKAVYVNLLTDQESMATYEQVFTHKSIEPELNYERFEILGDLTCNKFLVWYFSRRFPKLFSTAGVKILAELRIKYGSKIMMAPIAEEYGFLKFISAIEGEFEMSKTSLQEDVFEAFIGDTDFLIDTRIRMGVGYSICYDILKAFYDTKHIGISYEELHSPISRLKEIFDKQDVQKRLNVYVSGEKTRVKYDTVLNSCTNDYTSKVYFNQMNQMNMTLEQVVLATRTGTSKVAAENNAAISAIEYLRRNGINDDEKAKAYTV